MTFSIYSNTFSDGYLAVDTKQVIMGAQREIHCQTLPLSTYGGKSLHYTHEAFTRLNAKNKYTGLLHLEFLCLQIALLNGKLAEH